MDKRKGFSCDKEAKEKVLKYYKKKAEEKGYKFIENYENNNKEKARIDLMFAVSSNTKYQKYAIEIKERNNTIDKYDDIMFEEDKMDELKKLENEDGYISYFVNVFNNDSALQYDTSVKYITGISYQSKYTVKPSQKQNIIKIYLPKSGTGIKWINLIQ